jgi:hypothetical protein
MMFKTLNSRSWQIVINVILVGYNGIPLEKFKHYFDKID